MKVDDTALAGVKLLSFPRYPDARGAMVDLGSRQALDALGIPASVLDLLSISVRGVVRGLHYQHPAAQGKLVTLIEGSILDVVVDIRASSPTFREHVAIPLTDEAPQAVWIPEGFAHGFVVRSARAVVLYKLTGPHSKESEGGLLWNDPDLGIPWGIEDPILSEKDARHPRLRDVPGAKMPS